MPAKLFAVLPRARARRRAQTNPPSARECVRARFISNSLSVADHYLTAASCSLGYLQGSGGGPSEGNVSGYLIRSTATSWAKNSLLAVDAGTHLAGIIRIFDEHQARSPPSPDIDPASPRRDGLSIADGSNHDRYEPRRRRPPLPHPFAGAGYPKKTARANAAWVTRELVSTYLITHPHLDHVSGFVVNTASFTHSDSPKRLAALPAAIKALKTHMFNDVIWPNLSDENGGAGLVTYQRIQEMAEYVPVCNGLSVQAWPVSHGHCMKRHSHRGRNSTAGLDGLDVAPGERSPGGTPRVCVYDSAVYFIRDDATAKEVMMWGDVEPGIHPPRLAHQHVCRTDNHILTRHAFRLPLAITAKPACVD